MKINILFFKSRWIKGVPSGIKCNNNKTNIISMLGIHEVIIYAQNNFPYL